MKNKDFYEAEIIGATLEHKTLGVEVHTKELKPCSVFDGWCQISNLQEQ